MLPVYKGTQRIDPADILNYLQEFILPALGGGGGGGGVLIDYALETKQDLQLAELIQILATLTSVNYTLETTQYSQLTALNEILSKLITDENKQDLHLTALNEILYKLTTDENKQDLQLTALNEILSKLTTDDTFLLKEHQQSDSYDEVYIYVNDRCKEIIITIIEYSEIEQPSRQFAFKDVCYSNLGYASANVLGKDEYGNYIKHDDSKYMDVMFPPFTGESIARSFTLRRPAAEFIRFIRTRAIPHPSSKYIVFATHLY